MYLTSDHDDYGLTFVKDAKAVVHQQVNGKWKWQEYDTVSDAIDALGDADKSDSNGKLGFDGRITAVLNSNGVAKWVVIDSNTDVVTGTTTGGSDSGVYVHDDGDGYLSLTSTKNLTAPQIRNAILDSLYAKPGQKIAFVGSTGAGKTTITNLINRFYEIEAGTITYDGIDIQDIAKESLRRSLGIVLQDTHLFTGTIADNIRYGKLNATDEEVRAAARLANADTFIRHLPNGYDTYITGDGGSLSQGERQLLNIARAAVADPPVLILDEATSSIDTRTERLIEKGMDRLMRSRTVFVIAHRLSTVRNAKAILVLEQGEVIERGDHDDLISQKGKYYQLYTGQAELS